LVFTFNVKKRKISDIEDLREPGLKETKLKGDKAGEVES
jgi:hypothetical protein